MDHRSETRDFLTSRRARITPEQAGLPDYGSHRRVPGLRREEADLARQAGSGRSSRAPRRRAPQRIRPGVQHILDAMTGAPAYVRNGRLDLLGANDLARAVFSPVFRETTGTPNMARFIFLDPAAQDFYRDWDQLAEDVVALLRGEAGRDPYDRDLTELIGELTTRSEHFRTWWAAHNVRLHRAGVKRLHHPLVGDLTLAYESMELTADHGLRLNAYSAAPGSPDRDALDLLASWAAPAADPQQARDRA